MIIYEFFTKTLLIIYESFISFDVTKLFNGCKIRKDI